MLYDIYPSVGSQAMALNEILVWEHLGEGTLTDIFFYTPPPHTHTHTHTRIHTLISGARLHHQLPEERDAQRVREGQQEKGADWQPGGDLQPHRKRAPDITRRLPQPEEDAGQ